MALPFRRPSCVRAVCAVQLPRYATRRRCPASARAVPVRAVLYTQPEAAVRLVPAARRVAQLRTVAGFADEFYPPTPPSGPGPAGACRAVLLRSPCCHERRGPATPPTDRRARVPPHLRAPQWIAPCKLRSYVTSGPAARPRRPRSARAPAQRRAPRTRQPRRAAAAPWPPARRRGPDFVKPATRRRRRRLGRPAP